MGDGWPYPQHRSVGDSGAPSRSIAKSDDDDTSFEVEPPLPIPYRGPEGAASVTTAGPASNVDLARLEQDLNAPETRPECRASFQNRSAREVEANSEPLRVVRLQADLENARLAVAKKNSRRLRKAVRPVKSPKKILRRPRTPWHGPFQPPTRCRRSRERAELEAAEANVRRQQQLLSLGSGRKSRLRAPNKSWPNSRRRKISQKIPFLM
jgi:ribosomal protein L13E